MKNLMVLLTLLTFSPLSFAQLPLDRPSQIANSDYDYLANSVMNNIILWIMYSTDYGNSWNAERIAADGVPNLVSNYHTADFAPLFENFGQVDGAIDDSGYVHIAANGYGVVVSGTQPYKNQFPMLYWNSITRNWIAISSINIDTLQAIADYYPGSLIGQSYPSIVVTPMRGYMNDVVVCWTAPRLDLSDPSGLALSNGFYKTDAVYAYPYDLREPNNWGRINLNDLYPDDNMIYATVGPDYLGFDPFDIPLLYMNDLEAGISVFGQGNPTLNPIKLFLLSFQFVSNDDIHSDMDFYLGQNYPNPFNPSTKISWQSPVSSWQTLKVYDVLGNEVTTLVDEFRDAGRYEIEFQSALGNRQLASGIYFYRLQVVVPSTSSGQGFVETKKMILLR